MATKKKTAEKQEPKIVKTTASKFEDQGGDTPVRNHPQAATSVNDFKRKDRGARVEVQAEEDDE